MPRNSSTIRTVSTKSKKASFWIRRRSHLPTLLLGTLVVMLLAFNDDISITQNMEYDRQINDLQEQIESCRDSAAFYRRQREAIIHGTGDLERMAREKFHMQRPTEDVFLIK